jgi:8-oxo-dGTP diphosphatase
MVKHRQNGQEWWCLPGGGIEEGENPAQAALRELKEECQVDGTILRETSTTVYSPQDKAISFLIDIGKQEPCMGSDPELEQSEQVLVDMKWLKLWEIPERDRVFLWAAGILGIEEMFTEVSTWSDEISYPR